MKPTPLTDDKREIKTIAWNEDSWYSTTQLPDNNRYATKIIPYNELGIGSENPWLAVYKDDQIICRVPAYQVAIYY